MKEIILAADLTNTAAETGNLLAGNWQLLVAGIILIIIAAIIIMSIKRIIVNSVLGVICWIILFFVLKIELQLIPTLVISVIFGLAGIGVILVLKFLGIPI